MEVVRLLHVKPQGSASGWVKTVDKLKFFFKGVIDQLLCDLV